VYSSHKVNWDRAFYRCSPSVSNPCARAPPALTTGGRRQVTRALQASRVDRSAGPPAPGASQLRSLALTVCDTFDRKHAAGPGCTNKLSLNFCETLTALVNAYN